ncbi:MAG TPA: 16S rRNA (guanine(527)-N(7))-methyltransferase RsmG [Pirellulaceae bacterium]|nr:16S rRNA (guanine(527)-N(7))-methyltransferase RsmG [Pirellulaceae bacterium]HMO93129.1 16S rRNA (guanine(527)-N(7))-methyltransferase RsmG [Pirellulaceae bacterium]HMP70312.1 16S rRNA (guanine(527)-N(7))-methyltransferase RsmG [Pirellulaceae bacterium]
MNLRSELRCTLERFKIELPTDCVDRLSDYASLVWEQNKTLNLTRHTTAEKFVLRDVLDTIELSKLIHHGEEVLDIGRGGGVPGLTLAMMRPDLQISLCDSVAKKANAVQQIARSLELDVAIYPMRAEELLEASRFDVCTARAVGSIAKLCRWLDRVWLEVGRLLAVKGPKWKEERDEAAALGLMKRVKIKVATEYTTPEINAQNFILKIWSHALPEK